MWKQEAAALSGIGPWYLVQKGAEREAAGWASKQCGQFRKVPLDSPASMCYYNLACWERAGFIIHQPEWRNWQTPGT